MSRNNPRPEWLTVRLLPETAAPRVLACLRGLGLGTVCASAQCPNRAECHNAGRATFLLMGPNCSRHCRYCAVKHAAPAPLDPTEPERVAEAAARLGLRHVVMTSVTRDDLPDGGAAHFARAVACVRRRCPGATVEILVPDFGGVEAAWETSAACAPEVYNHNLETVERLFPAVRPGADFRRSLRQLAFVKERHPGLTTKSGLMVGLGEGLGEVLAAGRELRAAGVDVVTVGQYLAPDKDKNCPVARYVPPEEFARLREGLLAMGFAAVAAAPLVRSSYQAAETFAACGGR